MLELPPGETGFVEGAITTDMTSVIGQATRDAIDAGVGLRGNALYAVVAWAACRGLNEFADAVFERSQAEVPEALEHDYERWPEGSLAESGKAPMNSIDHRATPAYPIAQVSYDTPYAMAQHEGEMEYINPRSGKTVRWVARSYTKPGSKSHYLEDPFKMMLPELEGFVAASVQEALAGLI